MIRRFKAAYMAFMRPAYVEYTQVLNCVKFDEKDAQAKNMIAVNGMGCSSGDTLDINGFDMRVLHVFLEVEPLKND